MHPAIETIRKYDIPVGSYLQAIRHLMERPDLAHSQYVNLIREIVGEPITDTGDDRQTKYTFLYLVQEAIRASDNTDKLDMLELHDLAFQKAKNYIASNPWVWAQPEDAERLDEDGKPKRKKGAKQEEAARIYNESKADGKAKIIERFMAELDMSKAGATTYFYNMKKQFGE